MSEDLAEPEPQGVLGPPPRPLETGPEERAFLARVAVAVRTPRAVKKLTNMYRLLRASVPEDDTKAFVDGVDGPPDHRAALVLFAVLIGFPEQAPDLIGALRTTHADGWRAFVEELALDADPVGAASVQERLDRHRRHRLHTFLMSELLLAEMPEDLRPYRRWAPEVARYSFATGQEVVARAHADRLRAAGITPS